MEDKIPQDFESMEVAKDLYVKHATNATEPTDLRDVERRELADEAKKSFSIRSFAELAKSAESIPELKKIFGNHILEGTTTLLPAERGVGKTLFSLELAIAVSEGHTEFLGEEIELHGNTLYVNMELGEPVLMRRLKTLYKSIEPNPDNPYKAYAITGRKSLSKLEDELEDLIEEHEPVLVIIDNLRTAFSDSDNEKNKEMTRCINNLNDLRDDYGFALVLIHHTKKGSTFKLTNSDLQSGAGAISDLVDGDLFIRRSQKGMDLRLLKRAKSRNTEEQEGATLIKLNPETLWFELIEDNVNESEHIFVPGSPTTELSEQKLKAKKLYAEGKTEEEIGKLMNRHKSTISRWLNNSG